MAKGLDTDFCVEFLPQAARDQPPDIQARDQQAMRALDFADNLVDQRVIAAVPV